MSLLSQLHDEQRERLDKSVRLCIFASMLFAIVFARLFYVQVIQARQNIRLSQENGMQFIIQKAPRGLILDRNGTILARNRPSYSICILPYKVKNRHIVIENLCSIRDGGKYPVFDSTELKDLIRKAFKRRFDITRLKEDVCMDIVSIVEEHSMELPGITVETESRREYLLGPSTFHLLGYMSEIPENQFDSLKKLGYHYGDMAGKAGIEKQYEVILRGRDGQEYIEVDAYGKSLGPIATMPRQEPVAGDNIYCTIDVGLQKMASDSFPDSLKGAVVALNPQNGEVLAMFSSPAPDPNIFSQASSLRAKNWATIALDSTLPLNNRATCGVYPPGSTFKLISAIAGLAGEKLTAESHMPTPCRGAFRFGARIAHCWKPEGHGSFNLVDAVRQSCDIYFYQVGLRLGDSLINRYAALFGLGAPTGIDFPVEKAGWLSGEEEYNKRFASRKWVWTKGLDMDLAIGQTQLVTPIQLATMVGAMGNGHTVYRPFLLREVRSPDSVVVKQNKPAVARELGIDSSIIAVMHRSMLAVTEAGGTAGRAQVPHVPVGGKTGSAENPHGELTHALFGGCAPVDNPVIAVAVVAENAGHGGSIAAPVAGALLRYYFANNPEGKRIVQEYKETEAPVKKARIPKRSAIE
jgi:penicillin-binding protein 2